MKAQQISTVLARDIARDVLNGYKAMKADPRYILRHLEYEVNDRLRYCGAGWHIKSGTRFDEADCQTIKALAANVQRAAVPGKHPTNGS
ncbi:MAG: hypothetical protein DDT39_01602 [Firmicutes bacterium]|nr:hypothetical protein [candidate division NPL-UPA2 bacterium]